MTTNLTLPLHLRSHLSPTRLYPSQYTVNRSKEPTGMFPSASSHSNKLGRLEADTIQPRWTRLVFEQAEPRVVTVIQGSQQPWLLISQSGKNSTLFLWSTRRSSPREVMDQTFSPVNLSMPLPAPTKYSITLFSSLRTNCFAIN